MTGRLDARLALPALAAWMTAWLVRGLPPRVLVLAAVGTVVAAAGALMAQRSVVAAVLVCAAAAALATAARTEVRRAEPLAGLGAASAAVTVEGVLVDDPRRSAASLPSRQVVVARLRVEALSSGGRTYELRAPVVVLSTSEQWLGLLPSQRVRVEGRLRSAEPGDDVAAVLSARGPPIVMARPSVVQRVAGRLRAGLRAAAEPLPAAEQGLLPGLVVGDVSRLDADLREDFRTTGLSHLTAVSGTNVAIVVGAALLLARLLGLGVVGAPAVAALALAGFVVLARPSPSVLRAAVMGVVGLVALVSGTRRAALPSLCAAVLVLVLLQPDLAAAPGFALSVLATGGLLLLAPPLRVALRRHLPSWLADAVAVPAAASVACAPIVVAISGTLGVLSVPANLLAVPAVAPATVLGVLAALAAPVSVPVAQALAWLAYLPTAWLVRIARTGAAVPGAGAGWPGGTRGAVLLALAIVLVLFACRRRTSRRLLAASAAGCLVAVAGLAAAAPAWPPSGWFLVTCDVGQGDAIAIRTGPGAAVLVDAGPDPRAVDRCLRRLDVSALPLVLLTHLHADHVDGLPGALRGRAVGEVQIGPLAEPARQQEQVAGLLRSRRIALGTAALGEVRAAGGVGWQVLAPGRVYRGTTSDPNNSSVVLRLVARGVVVLLTGDIEPEAQRHLLAAGAPLRADVIKVPHHGSRHQDLAFLSAVQARLALTSVGADNTYGHPAASTLGQLMDGGARSYRTDHDGDIALVEADGALHAVGSRGRGTVRGQQLASARPAAALADGRLPLPSWERASASSASSPLRGAHRPGSALIAAPGDRGGGAAPRSRPRARSPPRKRRVGRCPDA